MYRRHVVYRYVSGTNYPFSLKKDEVFLLKNELHIGDNLAVLRDKIRDESVDLVYLDPPFNSKQDYNLIFKERGGKRSSSQELVFKDTWKWNPKAEDVCRELIEDGGRLSEVIRACRTFLGDSDMMAYLAMMAPRLREMHRVLKPTGSLYLHCDPTASHYLKMLMDAIFGPEHFLNEIIWKRTNTHSDAKRWSPVSDTILYYSKGDKPTWNPPLTPHSQEHISRKYGNKDEHGKYTLSDMTSPRPRPNMMYEWKGHASPPYGWRYSKETMARLDSEGRIWYPDDKSKRPRLKRYLNKMPGVLMGNVWTDINPINSQAQERLKYPTQKPISLLKRIIEASSNMGDTVLDPFCGCGTAIEVCEETHRHWIGIDVTYLAAAIVKQRLIKFGPKTFKNIRIEGEPVNVDEAVALAQSDKFGFQCWAVGRLGAPPIEHRKGADRGIDGRIYFHDDFGSPKHIIISVKAGEHIGPAFVRELRGVVEREKAVMGIMVCVKKPTPEMAREAYRAGNYLSLSRTIPKLQIITVEDIFADKTLNIPGRLDPFDPNTKKPSAGVRQVRPIEQQLRLLP
jgi:site-specific DNA-methyltransferase (adenine-specific)